MHVPNAFHRGQQQFDHHAATWLEDANHGERFVGVDVGLVFSPWALKTCLPLEVPLIGDLAPAVTSNGASKGCPSPPWPHSVRHRCALFPQCGSPRGCLHKRGECLRRCRVLQHLFSSLLVDVAPGASMDTHWPNQLYDTLRAEHQINVFDVAFEGVIDLLFCQQHQTDHSDTKCEQSQTQCSLSGLLKAAPRLVEQSELHERASCRVTQWG